MFEFSKDRIAYPGRYSHFFTPPPPKRKPFPHECNAWCEPEEMGEGRQHCDITYTIGDFPLGVVAEGFRRHYPHLNVVHFEEAKKAPPPGQRGLALTSQDGKTHYSTKKEIEAVGRLRCYRYWVRLTPYTWIAEPIKAVGVEEEVVEDAIDPYTG